MNRLKSRKFSKNIQISYFSLTELMVVLLIIGLVVGLVGPAIFNQFDTAKTRTAESQVDLLKECVRAYFLDLNAYPSDLSDLESGSGACLSFKNTVIGRSSGISYP